MELNRALSNVNCVLAAADSFFQIADLLHRRLNSGPLNGAQSEQPTTELYSLLVEEYGLRARAAILRNDAVAHTVGNTTIDQTHLLAVLNQAGKVISEIDHLDQLRSIVADVSTLCVGISPGKGLTVDFLLGQLQSGLAPENRSA